MVSISCQSTVSEVPAVQPGGTPQVLKVYNGISDAHAARLATVYSAFEQLNLGPRVNSLEREPGRLAVTMEKVLPLCDYLPEHPGERDAMLEKALDLCRRMHAADWVHGDFYPMNMGLRATGELVAIDLDTVIPISAGANEDWIVEVIEGNYGPVSFEDYVKMDAECIESTIDDAVAGAFRSPPPADGKA